MPSFSSRGNAKIDRDSNFFWQGSFFSYTGPYFLQTSKCREASQLSYEGADRNRHRRVFSPSWSTERAVMESVGGQRWTRSVPFPWAGTVELFEVPSERSRVCHVRAVLFWSLLVLLSFFTNNVRGSWDVRSGTGEYELQLLSLKMLLLLF